MTEFRRMRFALLAAAALSSLANAQIPPAAEVQSLDSIRARAEEEVRRRLVGTPGRTIVTAAPLDARLRFARCGAELAVAVPGDAVRDRMIVGVSCREGPAWSVYVRVTVETEIAVLVAKQPVPRGGTLSAGDVTVQVKRVRGAATGWLGDPAALSGRLLRRPVAAGEALTADAFVPAPVVRRGQQVTLVAAVGGIEVRAPGRALADGTMESRVRVQNLGSQKIVEGYVQGPDVIRITP